MHVWWTRVWVATDGSSPVQSLLSSDWEQRGLLEADNAVLEFGMRSDPQHAKADEATAQHALHLGLLLKAAGWAEECRTPCPQFRAQRNHIQPELDKQPSDGCCTLPSAQMHVGVCHGTRSPETAHERQRTRRFKDGGRAFAHALNPQAPTRDTAHRQISLKR